jgi:acrylyl-CoA reductase (NADPH)
LYSSLNYKDALAVTARGKVIRKFPLVCGIDLAGRVLESSAPDLRAGDEVLAVGQGLGESRWGGYSQRARVAADALIPIPSGLDAKQAMAIGTAGFTAMLSIIALENYGVKPGEKEILVTGATGGVGSVAILLLAGKGYKVAASTGREEFHSYLRNLGAATIVSRAELEQKTGPLASERWGGAIDSVGGQTLSSLIAATSAYGAIAACGMAGGAEFSASVFPFILRNVGLLGINSVNTPKALRKVAWERLARELPLAKLDSISSVEPLSEIVKLSQRLLAGGLHGRVVIDVNN